MQKEFNQKEYIKEYKKTHYKQFKCDLPINLNAELEKKLKTEGKTKKQFLLDAINNYLNS